MAFLNGPEQVPAAGDVVTEVRPVGGGPVGGSDAVIVDFASGKSVWFGVTHNVPTEPVAGSLPTLFASEDAPPEPAPPVPAPDWSAVLKWVLALDFLAGYRSYVAAAGLVGLGVYQLANGDAAAGVQSVLAGLAVLGVRKAAAKE